MTREEASRFLWDKAEAVDLITAPQEVGAWAQECKTFLFNIDNAPAENVVPIIWEYGYIRGIEFTLFMAGHVFKKEAELAEQAGAWRVLVDDFIEKAGIERYGIE